MQMGVTPRECPRAGMQLPWDGSCWKIIRVRGLIPNQMALANMLCHHCAPKAVPEPWALVMPQKKSMQLGWDSPLLWGGHTGGVGLFLPRAIWKSWANKETGPGQETQQLHSADKCPETIKHKSMEKMGSLVLSTPFFMCRDLRCQSQRDQTSADNPVIFKFIFGCGNVICG